MVGAHRCPHKQIARVVLRFEYVVVEENTLRGAPVLGKNRNQPGFELVSQAIGQSPNVRITDKKIDFIFAFGIDRLNLRAKLLLKSLKELKSLLASSCARHQVRCALNQPE